MKKIFFLFCIVLLASCQSAQDRTLTIGVLKGPSAISVAQWLSKPPVVNGKTLHVIICDEVTDLQAKMIQGKVDYAVLPTTVAAILYNKGVDYRILACPVQGSIYVLTNDNIQSFNDLRKKEVSVSGQGTTPDVLFTLLATKYNFRNKDLVLDYKIGNHPDLAQAVMSGKIKTALLPEPFVTLVTAKNPHVKAVINLSDELAKQDSSSLFALSAFVASKQQITQHRADVDSVAARYQAAINWLADNPSPAAAEVVKAGILPDEGIAKKSIARCSIRYLKIDENLSRIVNYLHIFYRFDPKIVGGKMPDKEFYFNPKK